MTKTSLKALLVASLLATSACSTQPVDGTETDIAGPTGSSPALIEGAGTVAAVGVLLGVAFLFAVFQSLDE